MPKQTAIALGGIHRQAGTYALLLRARQNLALQIGRCGQLAIQPGCYVYIGSAFGPGGVRARVQHHCHVAAKPHWHVDYLRQVTEVEAVWYSHDLQRQEHSWAATVGSLRGAALPLPGFGASDCSCPAHLFFFATAPRLAVFQRRLHAALASQRHAIVSADRKRLEFPKKKSM